MNPLTSLLSRASQGEARKDYESLLPTFPLGTSIPKRIWRIFIAQRPDVPVPELAQQTEANLRSLNPDYEITMADNAFVEHFIRENYGELIWQYYLRIDPNYGATRADFFRYLLLYKEGGVYIDLKMSFSRPLSETIRPDDKLLLSHWDNLPGEPHEGWGHLGGLESIPRGEYIMGLIPVTAGHPFMREVILAVMHNIDVYNPYIHNSGFEGTLFLTGPVTYTLVAERMKSEGRLSEERGDWREISFVHDLGLIYPVTKLRGLSDYRSNAIPIIPCRNALVRLSNERYFRLLGWYRQRILKRGK